MKRRNQNDVVQSVILAENSLNAAIIENIFRLFIVSILFFAVGMYLNIVLTAGRSPLPGNFMWIIFFFFIALFGVVRYLPQSNKYAGQTLVAVSLLSGLLLVPYLEFIHNEFGQGIIGRGLLTISLLFIAFSALGWSKSDFMPRVYQFIKYGILILVFLSLIAPFISWNEGREQMFAGAGLIFVLTVTYFDFQKLKYYPKRAVASASTHIFMGLILGFVLVLRLLSAIAV